MTATQMNKNHVPVTQTSTGYDPRPSIHVNHPISDNDPGPPIHASIQTITSHVPDTRGPPIPVNIQTITIEDVQPLSANEFSEGFARYPITLAIDYRSRYNQIPFDKESHDLIALDHIPDTRLMLSGYDPGPLMHANYTLPGYDPGPPINANIQAIMNHASDMSGYDPGPSTYASVRTITIEDHAHRSHQLMTNANGSRWKLRDLVSVILSWYIVLKTLTDYRAFERSLKTPYFSTWKNSMVSLWLPLLPGKSLTITVRKLMERFEFVRLWRGIQKLIQRTFLRKDEIYYLYCWKILRGELEQI